MIRLITDDISRYFTILHNFKAGGVQITRVSSDVLGNQYVYTERGFKPISPTFNDTIVQELAVELSLDHNGEVGEYQLFECQTLDIRDNLVVQLLRLGVERE